MVIYNPFTTTKVGDTYTRDPFVGNKIAPQYINAVGQKIANLYPLPNRQGEGPALVNNFYAQGKSVVENDKVDWRVDWAQSEKHRLFVRFSQRVRQDGNNACFICNGADPGYRTFNPGFQGTINDTVTPSPSWVINVLAGASRWQEGQTSLAYGLITPGSLGLNPADYQAPVMPTISVDLFNGLGNNGVRKLTRYAHTLQGNVTKQVSSHTLKFGGNFDVSMINNFDEISGSYSFNRGITSCDPTTGGACQVPSGNSKVTGSGLASLLVGVGGGSVQLRPDKAMSLHFFGAYLQDTWRATRRLTLDLGLRYENQRPVTERYNRIASFDPNVTNPISSTVSSAFNRPLLGGIVYATPDNRGGWPADNKNFAPRIGAAFKVTDRLVTRAGFGVFYMPASAMISYDDGMFIGFGTNTNWVSTQNGLGYIPTSTLSNVFPTGANQPTGSQAGLVTQLGEGLSQIWPVAPHPTGYSAHFSFDVQYQVATNSVLEVGYTGWRGRKMMYGEPLNANQLPTQYLKLGSDVLNKEVPNPFYNVITSPNSPLNGPTVQYWRLLVPYPQYSSLNYARSLPGARANFDALNVKFNHTFNASFNWLSTYQ